MSLETSKTLGGIGAILLLVGAVGFFVQPAVAFAAFIGVILSLVALHGLADYYRERGIFNNALWGFIALVVGVIVAAAALIYLFLYTDVLTQLVQAIYPTWNGNWSTPPTGPTVSPQNLDITKLIPPITTLLEVYAIFCVFVVIASFFVWRSLKQVGAKSNIGLFGTAGILLFIGGILSVLIIGFVLMAIAVLLMAIAFFELRPQPQQPAATAAPLVSTPTPV